MGAEGRRFTMAQANLNTREYWDSRWLAGGTLSRKCEKVLMKLVTEDHVSVLDIGCGSGRILRGLRKDKKCDVFGIDISPVAITKLSHQGIPGVVGRAEELHTLQKKFDVVICSHTLEHIDDDAKLVRDIAEKAFKYAIFAVPNNAMGPEECPDHVRKYTTEGLTALLSKYFKRVEDHSTGIHLILKAYA